MKNFYDILNVSYDASPEQIKSSYKKLILIYHPDKPGGNKDKFIDVQNAYDILCDINKKKSYDNLNNDQQHDFYDLLKLAVKNHVFSDIDPCLNLFINDESKLRSVINSFLQCDIDSTVDITYKDKYSAKYKKVDVHFYLQKLTCTIPLFVDKHDSKFNNYIVHFSLNIIDSLPPNYSIINNDICINHYVTLYDYLYGHMCNISVFDTDTIVNINIPPLTPLKVIKNIGMPFFVKDGGCIKRGKLYIIFKIKQLDDLKSDIEKLCLSEINKKTVTP